MEEKGGRAEFNTQRKKCQLRERGAAGLPLVQPSWVGVRMRRPQEEPGEGRGGGPGSRTSLSGSVCTASCSLPPSPPAAASQSRSAWESESEARGKASCPGREGGGSLLSSAPQRCCHQEMRVGPGAQEPQKGSQGEASISFLEMSHAGKVVLWGSLHPPLITQRKKIKGCRRRGIGSKPKAGVVSPVLFPREGSPGHKTPNH